MKIHVIHSTTPGDSSFGAAGHAELADYAAIAFGHPHPDFEGYAVSFNLLALVIMVTAWLMFREKKGDGEKGGTD